MDEFIISSNELRAELKSHRDLVLLDVRSPEEHQECHIDGDILIPLDELHRRARNELKPGSDIVIYCAHGVRSLHALQGLRQMGFEKVRSLQGGIAAWLEGS